MDVRWPASDNSSRIGLWCGVPREGESAKIAGALAVAVGRVFLVVGRADLFTENFFDPVAPVFDRHASGLLRRLLRLWGVRFALNLVVGALLPLAISVHGVRPDRAGSALSKVAEEIAARGH